jgi:hypothetical protein
MPEQRTKDACRAALSLHELHTTTRDTLERRTFTVYTLLSRHTSVPIMAQAPRTSTCTALVYPIHTVASRPCALSAVRTVFFPRPVCKYVLTPPRADLQQCYWLNHFQYSKSTYARLYRILNTTEGVQHTWQSLKHDHKCVSHAPRSNKLKPTVQSL